MKQLIECIAKRLVDSPDEVQVREVAGDTMVVYELRVARGEVGMIVGKHGRTIRAFRTVVTGAGGKDHAQVGLEIVE